MCVRVCVCVNRSPDCTIWPNYEVVEFQPWSVIATVLYSVTYWYALLPCLPGYYSPHISFHMRSFSHPVVVCLRPIIPTYHMRSTSHPGVSCILTIIPTTRYASLTLPVSYYLALPSHRLWLLASQEITSRFSRSSLHIGSIILFLFLLYSTIFLDTEFVFSYLYFHISLKYPPCFSINVFSVIFPYFPTQLLLVIHSLEW